MSERQYGVDRKTLELWIEKARNGETDILIHGIQKTMECQERYVMVAEWVLAALRRDLILTGNTDDIADRIAQMLPAGAAAEDDESFVSDIFRQVGDRLRHRHKAMVDPEDLLLADSIDKVRLILKHNRHNDHRLMHRLRVQAGETDKSTETNNERIES